MKCLNLNNTQRSSGFKFLVKLAHILRKLVFFILSDLHVCYSKSSFERNSEDLIQKKA